MNLNHIAKKPYFDLFYKTPCMAQMLRLAFNDACTYDASTKTGGVIGSLRHKQSLLRPENEGLSFAVGQARSFKKEGNHITNLLTISDIIHIGGIAAIE